MKPLFYFLTLAILAAMVAGCDQPGGCGGPHTIALTEADNGNTIEMDLVDQIKITLPSNPSTGYSWENVLTEGSLLVQVGDSVYTSSPACVGRDGCGGTQTFYFRAVSTGTGQIKLIYHRPWESVEPIHQFEITALVN